MAAIAEVLVFTVAVTAVYTLIARAVVNIDELRKVREELRFYQDKSKEARKRGDLSKANEHLKEMMKVNQKMFRLNIKPLLVSLVVFFLALAFLRANYTAVTLQLPATLPLLSPSFPFIVLRDSIGWFWWYVFVSLSATLTLRKLVGLQ